MFKGLILFTSFIFALSACSSAQQLTIRDQIKDDVTKQVSLIDDSLKTNKKLSSSDIGVSQHLLVKYNAKENNLNQREKNVLSIFGDYAVNCSNYDGIPSLPDVKSCENTKEKILKMLK